MKDTLGTLLGFILGASLLVFGIIFPDRYSNYYVYQITTYDELITKMEEVGRPVVEIRQAKAELKQFKDSLVGSISKFLDIKSFGIVVGGAFAALLIAFPVSKAVSTIKFIALAFARRRLQEDFLEVYEIILRLLAKRNAGEIITDADIEEIQNDNLREWVQDFIAVDVVSEEMITEIIQSEIEMYNYRAYEEIDVLRFLGAATPAFGMVGTVVGLILMLGAASGENTSISDVMGSMSVALITTLYGVLAAQLILIPIASKRFQLKESNVKLLEMIQEGILYLKKRELVDVAAQDLIIYLPPKLRMQVEEERRAAMASGDLGL
ncbi:MotA/TolQ/ExbB proton channel family protein [bacterium]|nr:MotA/TolQ/ExbB proton channel family protein [bacterium]